MGAEKATLNTTEYPDPRCLPSYNASTPLCGKLVSTIFSIDHHTEITPFFLSVTLRRVPG